MKNKTRNITQKTPKNSPYHPEPLSPKTIQITKNSKELLLQIQDPINNKSSNPNEMKKSPIQEATYFIEKLTSETAKEFILNDESTGNSQVDNILHDEKNKLFELLNQTIYNFTKEDEKFKIFYEDHYSTIGDMYLKSIDAIISKKTTTD